MPQVIFTDNASRSLARLADFMAEKEPSLRGRVISTIIEGIEPLETFPKIAKCSLDERYKHMRELFIRFGSGGYIVLYEYIEKTDIVLINAIRHSKEKDYEMP